VSAVTYGKEGTGSAESPASAAVEAGGSSSASSQEWADGDEPFQEAQVVEEGLMISYIVFKGKAGREASVEKLEKGWNVMLFDPKHAKIKHKVIHDGRKAEKMANSFVRYGRMPKYLRTPKDFRTFEQNGNGR
jgi:hypothetical protein